MTHEMVDYINGIKYDLISETENIPIDSAKIIRVSKIKNKDDYTTPTNYFMGDSEDGSKGEAKELKRRINEYRENMMNLLDEDDRQKVKLGLKTDGKLSGCKWHEIELDSV